MNPITPRVSSGTIGELLVQLKLLEYGVQAAPPLKDSGNDLIAIKGEVIKALRIKAVFGGRFTIPKRQRKTEGGTYPFRCDILVAVTPSSYLPKPTCQL